VVPAGWMTRSATITPTTTRLARAKNLAMSGRLALAGIAESREVLDDPVEPGTYQDPAKSDPHETALLTG
jgi:hypothetical protein